MSDKKLSRRDFLKIAGLTAGGTALACAGTGWLATLTPSLETPQMTLGKENSMQKKVLVAYATRAGSTVEVAASIAQTLSARGFTVQVAPFKDNPSLAGCQGAVLGSAIRMGNWLPEAMTFIQSHQAELNALPVALFTVHMLNTAEDETSRTARLAYLDAVRALLPQASEVFFAGRMDYSRLSFLDRMVSKMVKAEEADQRNWSKISDWSNALFI